MHLNSEQVKVCYSDDSPIKMFAIQIPTVHLIISETIKLFQQMNLFKSHFKAKYFRATLLFVKTGPPHIYFKHIPRVFRQS